MELAGILTERSVVVRDKVRDKSELLEILAERGGELTGVPAEVIAEALTTREALGSTGLGNGIAIPHGKIAGLGNVVAVFARLVQPVEFDSVDDQPVDIAVMLLAPAGAGADHLKALALVARLLRTEALVDALRATDDPARLHGLLTAGLPSKNAA